MSKIKITEKQYNKLLMIEQQNRSIITENDNNVLLVVASLAGVDLTGNNKIKADKYKYDDKILSKIKSSLEDEDKLDDLIKKLEEKGLKYPEKFLAKNSDKIIDTFNQLSDKQLDFIAKNNLNKLIDE